MNWMRRSLPTAHTLINPNGHHDLSEPRLAFRGVSKRFGSRTVLDDVSLAVATQHIVVLLGPSGSGKTTLLRCAAGIERVSTGAVHIDGQSVDGRCAFVPPERRRLGMVFQDYALWPHLTVLDNVMYPLRRRKVGTAEAREQARTILARRSRCCCDPPRWSSFARTWVARTSVARWSMWPSPVAVMSTWSKSVINT